jgi:hypothetical protein
MQAYVSVWIDMLDAAPRRGGQDFNSQFFDELALECIEDRFAGFDFAAWEFPITGIRLAGRALGKQDVAIRLHQDADCYIDRCGWR